MPEKTTRTVLTCFVAIVMIVGFTAAPVAAVDDGLTGDDDEVTVGDDDLGVTVEEDGVEIRSGDDDTDVVDELDDGDDNETQDDSGETPADLSDAPVPEEVCTDAGDTVEEEVPVEDVPWLSDLPEDAQPPNVPAELVTPRTVVAIVTGVTPNQCEVQDPSDPSYDPLADGVDPDASATPAQGDYKDGFWGLVVYEATLDQSGSGPSASGMIWTLGSSEDGLVDPQVTINDGEKDYEINPTIGYADDGTGHAEIEAWAINRRAGTGVDCDGEECQSDASGVPADAPAVPAPTGQDGDEDSSQSDNEFPEEVCTDVPEEFHDNVPWDDLPWFDELPEDAQPPGIVTSILHPGSVSALVVGTAPNQCDVQDPNDPSYDPREDDVDPDGSATPAQGDYKDGFWGLVVYEATLDQSGSGPSATGKIWTLGSSEDGLVDPQVTINDGEKDYAINPTVGYGADGTGHADIDIRALYKGASVGLVCDGEECQPDAGGVPGTGELAIPAPTGQDDGGDDDSDDSDDSSDDSGSSNDGDDGSSGSSDSTDSDDATDTQTSAGGAGTAGGSGGQADDGSDGEADGSSDDADASNDAEEDTDDESDGDDAADADDDADDSSDSEPDDESESEPADEPVRSAAESDGDGPGFGVGLAVLSVLFATLMARRRLS